MCVFLCRLQVQGFLHPLLFPAPFSVCEIWATHSPDFGVCIAGCLREAVFVTVVLQCAPVASMFCVCVLQDKVVSVDQLPRGLSTTPLACVEVYISHRLEAPRAMSLFGCFLFCACYFVALVHTCRFTTTPRTLRAPFGRVWIATTSRSLIWLVA